MSHYLSEATTLTPTVPGISTGPGLKELELSDVFRKPT